ncbi:MAG: hypothetical protein PHF44_00025 [Candidatus Pacebacteria bacterium]|nr:hypothetical protein [Candidatus Paceibacterota bacterium]
MKIFITGSSGYIGRELVKFLNSRYQIIEYDFASGQDILDYEQEIF